MQPSKSVRFLSVVIIFVAGVLSHRGAPAHAGNVVWSWGAGDHGQLGNGANNDSWVPVVVSNLTNVKSIAADAWQGGATSFALTSDGQVWAWGDNSYGQFGNGTTTSSNVPVAVANWGNVTAISAGSGSTLALKNDGTVLASGSNYFGELGNGTNTNSNVPVAVSNLSSVVAISAGYIGCLALKNDGTVWTWGDMSKGSLDSGATMGSSNVPVPLSSLTSVNLSGVTAISEGWSYSLALKSDGTVWAWGTNNSGTSGIVPPDPNRHYDSAPTQVSNLSGVVAISAGSAHALALKNDGTVWAWGDNGWGELGNGTTTNSNVPVAVSNLSGVVAISAGRSISMALKSDGTVWTWGNEARGAAGNGNGSGNLLVPTLVSNLAGVSVTSIAAGNAFDLALAQQTAAPTVTGITPNSGVNTGLVNVTNLAGTGFLATATVKLTKTGQTDIVATKVAVVSSTQITCTFDLTGKATGQWNVVVTNPDSQSGTLANGFTINNPAPTVTGITPNSGLNSGSVSITNLAGTGFTSTATAAPTVKLTQAGQSDIVATNVVVVNSTKITCTFDLTGKATGQWNVVVTNPDGQSGTLAKGFTINQGAFHDVALTSFTASPNPVSRGAKVSFNVTVKNLGTYTENGVTFTMNYGSMKLAGPIKIGTWKPGQEMSGVLKLMVPMHQATGDYLITGQLSTVAGETNTDNNKQTVKVTVK